MSAHRPIAQVWFPWIVIVGNLVHRNAAVSSDDILGTKVWLDQHLFNNTLKTTKLASGMKVWMMNEKLAHERGVEDWPPEVLPTLCFLGLGEHSIEYLVSLANLFPELQLLLLDVIDDSWVAQLGAMLGDSAHRVSYIRKEDFAEERGDERKICQAISWSVDTPPFSFYKYRDLFYSSPYVLTFFNMQGCTAETRTERSDKYYCEYLYANFQATLCGRLNENKMAEYHGEELYFPLVDAGCGDNVCMCNAHSDAFVDFHFENLCRKGDPLHRFMGQWGQDRFLMRNVFRLDNRRGNGVYIDVGASHPYHLSNTAYFDLCLGWSGVCIDPNPRGTPVMQALRTCEVVTACAWANSTTMRFTNTAELAGMSDDDTLKPSIPYEMDPGVAAGTTYFESRCAPLHNLLLEAYPRSHVTDKLPIIDLLSVDAEGSEIEIFRDFPFQAWDIRSIVVETSRGTAMGIDSLLLPRGFMKIAVLGKDAVYVNRAQATALPPEGPLLPERIAWNEPGSDADTTDYIRFQRLFGATGNLDIDVGDQRLLNETEMERQFNRTDKEQADGMAAVVQAAKEAALGGVMSPSRRAALELEWVQDYLRDVKVKGFISVLLGDGDDAEEAAFRQLEQSKRLKSRITELIDAGVIVHERLAKKLGRSPPSD